MQTRGTRFVLLLTAGWFLAATAGLLLLADYDTQPGTPGQPPQHWPDEISLARNSAQPTLLMFLHPRCPCSRASLAELARLALRERDRLQFQVVFVQPAEVGVDWSQSDLWDSAVAHRDLHVVRDPGGVLAQSFGAATSGQVLVYDRQGILRFEGGITPGRGHVGDSFGSSLIPAIVAGQAPASPSRCATFGCPLSAQQATAEKPAEASRRASAPGPHG